MRNRIKSSVFRSMLFLSGAILAILVYLSISKTAVEASPTLVSLKVNKTYTYYDFTGDGKRDTFKYKTNGMVYLNGKQQKFSVINNQCKMYYYKYNRANTFLFIKSSMLSSDTLQAFRYSSGKLRLASEELGAYTGIEIEKIAGRYIYFTSYPKRMNQTKSFRNVTNTSFRYRERYYVNTSKHMICRHSNYGQIKGIYYYYYSSPSTLTLSTSGKYPDRNGPILNFGTRFKLLRVCFKYPGTDARIGQKYYEIQFNGKKGWVLDDENTVFQISKP